MIINNFKNNRNNGGVMKRLFRFSILLLILGVLTAAESYAQPQAFVSGRVSPGDVRVFVKDSAYVIDRDYVIGGTLIIEPGTTVYFYPNGRIIDSTGGRIIADGFASANYTANPGGLNPIAPGSPYNDGYADPGYFLYRSGGSTISVGTSRDITVNPSKYNYIFNVVFDTLNKRIVDLVDPTDPATVGGNYQGNNNLIVVTFEQAIMWNAARLAQANSDVNLKMSPWTRLNQKPINVVNSEIKFMGSPVSNFSREWGHIIVLPGARAAFFRNASFNGFRKDTTVDRTDYYNPSLPWASQVNKSLRELNNGSGGALTTYSSRTWLLDVKFKNNMARYRGGALQILQSVSGFPIPSANLGYYPVDKNPNITDRDLTPSSILEHNPVLRIDNIDETIAEPLTDVERCAYDDARLALYLGRMRNLTFDRNFVQIANVISTTIDGVPIVTDDLNNPASFPQKFGNGAFGGAIYIQGQDENRQIEVGLGVNNSIKIANNVVNFSKQDAFVAYRNFAANYQNAGSSEGSRGGAIYLGDYTSLIIAGDLSQNETNVPYMTDGTYSGYYSLGGAIYVENSQNRLQVRGGPKRADYNNRTLFYDNRAGAGGAIYVDGNAFPEQSPIIGGTDLPLDARNFGFDVKFNENKAIAWGGAIYTNRNFWIAGSGGIQSGALIGYDGNYEVVFDQNTAGFSGGAIHVAVPSDEDTPLNLRTVQIIRTRFLQNKVGVNIQGENRKEIRGGGAIYSLNAEPNLFKGVEFNGNEVRNGNGAALAIINPTNEAKRYFLSDVDAANFDPNTGLVDGYSSRNDIFTYGVSGIPATASMLTRFIDNKSNIDDDILASQSGSGATQFWEGTLQTSDKLLSTSWTDANNGVAVGYFGTIVKFENGGTKWIYPTSPTPYRLESVTFINTNTGFAVGDRGVILRTDNGGNNWSIVPQGITTGVLKDISFGGSNKAFAVSDDGKILASNDNGVSWILNYSNSNALYSIYIKTTDVAFAVGEKGTMLLTKNGGATWQTVSIPGLTEDLNAVTFINSAIGYGIGTNGTLIKTIDGGDTWTIVDSGTPFDFESINFYGSSVGYISGKGGAILKTTDGGNTWTMLNASPKYAYYDIQVMNNNLVYAVGDVGTLIKSNDGGNTWVSMKPADESYVDVKRYHQEINFPENGIGLGGGIYILDRLTKDFTPRRDSIMFNRVRFEGNTAYSGSALYSDNYDLKLIFTRSLITNNTALSEIGMAQNYITGAVFQDNNDKHITGNFASSDLVGATIYGEIQGPLPSAIFSEGANSIYGNQARFLIRLPDAPNTKGILAGNTGIGFGGTDTLRGNYWGPTEADVDLSLPNLKIKFFNPETGETEEYGNVVNETFFIAPGDTSYLPYLFPTTTDPRNQGPFETFVTRIIGSQEVIAPFTYIPVPALNAAGNENLADITSIPEKYLLSGNIYDVYDKGTDVKTADYQRRRLVPIEDFAVGIPPIVKTFTNNILPSFGKNVRIWTRDPYYAELMNDQNQLVYPQLNALQTEYFPDTNGRYLHPIGYPLYLESQVDYSGDDNTVNNDYHLLNQTVYFVINETTGDYIRVPLTQVSEYAPSNEKFRATVELVPDLSRRNPNPLVRRTAQGLSNFGTGAFLLENLYRNPYNEDAGALSGRKYIGDKTEFATVPNLFSNRPDMPASNFLNGISNTTFYAGEKYHALPVNVGDTVRIVSRTTLWREGANEAYIKGASFVITGSTEPPVFTGNIPAILNNTPKEFAGRLFVSEDRSYPAPFGSEYSQISDPTRRGRDSILTITAVDTNKFYDPRSWEGNNWSGQYPQLNYSWNVDYNSGLNRWLLADTIKAANAIKWKSRGYIQIKGTPINPYVVPGGEELMVGVDNYPPNYRTLDTLKASGAPQDVLDRFVETFPSYFSSPVYDILNARYLQQDTIDFGRSYSRYESIRMYITDSTPRFLDPGMDETELGPVVVIKDLSTRETDQKYYTTSTYTCQMTADGKLIANLTDKLRFQVDFNTDDELEDSWAIDWSFPYGKTAYGFANTTTYPMDGDTVVVDTVNLPGSSNIIQTKPSWMSFDFMKKYDTDDEMDSHGTDFTGYGKLNIRVPRDIAMQYLQPMNQQNQALNTDTMFIVVANDGHGGVTHKRMEVFVNIQPQILTNSLPDATEGTDYNPQLLDNTKIINYFDPNFGQKHKFSLIYVDDPRTSVQKDDCYDDAGSFDLTNIRTTPKWLKIDKETGLLYGVPGVKDAPADIFVSVIVEDENGLRDVATIPMKVNPINHNPYLQGVPPVACIDYGTPYSDTVKIIDPDLARNNSTEIINIILLDVNNNEFPSTSLDVSPRVVNGDGINDTISLNIFTNQFKLNPDPDGKITIKVVATDQDGNSDTLLYRLQISLETDFVANIIVKNSINAYQILQFGTSSLPNAKTGGVTTGDGTDSPDFYGVIDYQLCEFELPPVPPRDVFDARWGIPLRNGILRNIYPVALPNNNRQSIYKAQFQAGGVEGSSSALYPVTISWKPEEIPARDDATRNPAGSSWYIQDYSSNGDYFSFNMKEPDKYFKHSPDVIAGFNIDDQSLFEITITNRALTDFVIVQDWITGISGSSDIQEGIISVSPNPVDQFTNIAYGLPKSGDLKIDVVDALGNVVTTIYNGYQSAGTYNIEWNGSVQSGMKLASGAYTIRMVSDGIISVCSIMIVR